MDKETISKRTKTIKQKYGEDFYQRIGHKGGEAKVKKGFACMPIEKIRAAAAKGLATRRANKEKREQDEEI